MMLKILLHKNLRTSFLILNFLFFGVLQVNAKVTYTAKTGNWNAPATWNSTVLTGTATSSTASNTISGSGTLFSTEFVVGDALYLNNIYIGIIQTINSNTSITLVANAASSQAVRTVSRGRVPSAVDSVLIPASVTLTANTNTTVATINFTRTASILSVSSGILLSVSGAVTLNSYANGTNTSATINGLGTLNANSLNCGVSGIVCTNNSTNTFNINISFISITNNFAIYNNDEGGGNDHVPTININSSCNLSANTITLFQTGSGTGGSKVITLNANGATINLSGGPNAIAINSTVALTSNHIVFSFSASTINYNGSTAQTIPFNLSNSGSGGTTSTVAIIYGNLNTNNTSAGGATLNASITSTNVRENLNVQSGILNNNGFAITLRSSKDFVVSNGATFNLSGSSSMVSGATKTFGPSSTVNYIGTNQTVSNESYGKLALSGTGIKTFSGGNTSIAGNLSILSTTKALLSPGTNSTANSITLDGLGTNSGSWGSTSSNATNKDNTYFSLSTGKVNSSNDNRATAGSIGTSQTICSGSTPAALSSTSNGTGFGTISYEWQTNASGSYTTITSQIAASYQPPSLSATTSYKRRTVAVSGGATTYSVYTAAITITVNPNVTPTFTAVSAICSGASLSALPTTSNNAITGTWSPVLNNTATTTYTFTPTAGLCATTTTMTITVNPNVTPTFTAVSAICSGASLSALPTTSNNAITGTWSPVLNNTATTTYTFSPTAGLCATTTTMTITVLTGTPGLWTGLISSDWFDCRNWAGGLPNATIDAVIPSSSLNMPIIASTTEIASANNLVINAIASLTMALNSNLNISGEWRNSGIFNANAGTVAFIGNGTLLNPIQTINLGIKTNETFYNLTINGVGINLVDGFNITVSNALSLIKGDLRLTAQAQLVQLGNGINPLTGTGKVLKDQQGQSNLYNYNYWCSPVSLLNDATKYTISSSMKDGTNPIFPSDITWVTGFDGAPTLPIRIAEYWLNKFDTNTNAYANWVQINRNSFLNIGIGYTMKGSGTLNTNQNYTFVGKPNNGNISNPIGANQLLLTGNPYPSALDASAFINDNASTIDGNLYFWEHAASNNSHFLSDYTGGYAVRNLTGGSIPLAPTTIKSIGVSTKTPKEFIPVGQGFFCNWQQYWWCSNF